MDKDSSHCLYISKDSTNCLDERGFQKIEVLFEFNRLTWHVNDWKPYLEIQSLTITTNIQIVVFYDKLWLESY